MRAKILIILAFLCAGVFLPAGCRLIQNSGGKFSKIAGAFQPSWLMPDGMTEDPSAKPTIKSNSSSASYTIRGTAKCDRQIDSAAMSAKVDEFMNTVMVDAGAKNIIMVKPDAGKSFCRQISYDYGDCLGHITYFFSFSVDGKTAIYEIFVQEAAKSRPSGKGG